MDLGAVMEEVANRLRAIGGWDVHPQPVPTLVPPAAEVLYPEEYVFDETYGRGMDRMTLPVGVVVGRPTDRDTRDRIAKYCNGSGAFSVKQALESGSYESFDTLRVVSIDFGGKAIGGVDYLAAEFTLDITGPGSS